MWVLVVGREATLKRAGGTLAALQELGCTPRTADLWDKLDGEGVWTRPPSAILVEAGDDVSAARSALTRIKDVPALRDVPVLAALTVRALDSVGESDGFHDLVLMPYVVPELYLRLRRAEWSTSEFEGPERMKIGSLVLDLAGHEASVGGSAVSLTPQEFSLLRFLATHRGRVFSRGQLLHRVWGVDHYGGSRTVDIHVRRLRAKLGASVCPIQTVRGAGYKMARP